MALIATEEGRPEAPLAGVALGGVAWAQPSDRDALLALDRAALGCDRIHLIDALVELGPVAVIRTASHVTACAARRDFGQGEVVGPVIASNADHARALIVFLFAGRESAFLRVDTDEDSGLGPWLSIGAQTRIWRKFRAELPGIRLLTVRLEHFGPGDGGGWVRALGTVG